MKMITPPDLAPPQSNYSHGVELPAGARRLHVSGQVAVAPDGTVPSDLRDQLAQCWRNVFAVMRAAGFEPHHLARATVYVTIPGSIAAHREVRDAMLAGHRPANTYVEVSGLAAPQFLCEIEAEAADGS